MHRLILGFLVALGIVAFLAEPAIATQLHSSNPPVVLTPGQDQPLTCTTMLVGSLADPACATPIPTATPVTSTTLLPPGQQLYVGCADGSTPADFGTRFVGGHFQVFLTCPASTPTPTATP